MSDSLRRRSTAFQLGGNLASMTLSIIQGLFLVPLYLHYLGDEVYGLWLGLGAAVAMLAYIDLGITNIAAQKTAILFGSRKLKELGEFWGTLILWDLIAVIFIAIIGFTLSPLVPVWLEVPEGLQSDFTNAFRVATLDVMLMLIACMSASVLYGLQRPESSICAQLIGTALGIPLVFFLLSEGWGVVAIPCAILVRPLIMVPANIVALLRFVPRSLGKNKLTFSRSVFSELMRATFWLGPTQFFESTIGQLDNLIVLKLLGPVQVTSLEVTRKAGQLGSMLVGRISASLLSGLAHLHGEGNRNRMHSVLASLFRVTTYLSLVGLGGVLLLNESFVPLWTSKPIFGGNLLTALCVLQIFLSILKRTIFNVVFSFGEVRAGGQSSFIEFSVQVVLGIGCVNFFGLPGIPLAGIIAILAATSVQTKALLRHYPVDIRQVVFNFGRMLLVLMPAFLGAMVARALLTPQSWGEIVIFGLLYVVAAMLCILFFDRNAREAVLRVVRSKK